MTKKTTGVLTCVITAAAIIAAGSAEVVAQQLQETLVLVAHQHAGLGPMSYSWTARLEEGSITIERPGRKPKVRKLSSRDWQTLNYASLGVPVINPVAAYRSEGVQGAPARPPRARGRALSPHAPPGRPAL